MGYMGKWAIWVNGLYGYLGYIARCGHTEMSNLQVNSGTDLMHGLPPLWFLFLSYPFWGWSER